MREVGQPDPLLHALLNASERPLLDDKGGDNLVSYMRRLNWLFGCPECIGVTIRA